MTLDSFDIPDAVGTFVEEEVDGGEVWLEAVLLGENLKVRLFKLKPCKDAVRTFWMDRFAQVRT